MEIYQAAEKYNEHRDLLDSVYNNFTQDVWECHYVEFDGDGYFFLQIHIKLETHYSLERGVIQKQRGGTRTFKTFQAVMSALSQIGQPSVRVSW